MLTFDNRYPTRTQSMVSLRSELYPPTIRRHIRSLVIDVLARIRSCSKKDRSSHRVDILLLHSVFPDEVNGFRSLVSELYKSHKFISYNEAVTRITSDRIDGKYLAFSFDDGLKNCLEAASILEEFGARSCFFVCPDIVGVQSEEQIHRFCRDRLRHGPVEFMNWQDLALLRDKGHEIGGHTIGHIDVAKLPIENVRANLAECRRAIQGKLGSCEHFAWPFGRFRNFTEEAVQAVFEVGFSSCASGERGTHRPLEPGNSADVKIVLRRQSIEANWRQSHVDFFLDGSKQQSCPWELSRSA